MKAAPYSAGVIPSCPDLHASSNSPKALEGTVWRRALSRVASSER